MDIYLEKLAAALGDDQEQKELAQVFDSMSIAELEAFLREDEQEKTAFAVTPEGHEFDADRAEIKEEMAAKLMELSQRHHAMGSNKRTGGFMNVMRFAPDVIDDPRHYAYVAAKHREGKNAWNPFGGGMTPSKYERDGSTLQYGEMDSGHKFKSKDIRPKLEKKSSVPSLQKLAALPQTFLGGLAGKAMNYSATTPIMTRAAHGAAAGGAAGLARYATSNDPNKSLIGSVGGGAMLGAGGGAALGQAAKQIGGGALGAKAGGYAMKNMKATAKATGNTAGTAAAKEWGAARRAPAAAAAAKQRATGTTVGRPNQSYGKPAGAPATAPAGQALVTPPPTTAPAGAAPAPVAPAPAPRMAPSANVGQATAESPAAQAHMQQIRAQATQAQVPAPRMSQSRHTRAEALQNAPLVLGTTKPAPQVAYGSSGDRLKQTLDAAQRGRRPTRPGSVNAAVDAAVPPPTQAPATA